MQKLCFYILANLTIWVFASCNRHSEQVDSILKRTANIVEQYPDSALHLLDSIPNPHELNKKQFAQYTLRLVQAKTKVNKDISSDTLIFRAKDYFKSHHDKKNLVLSEFYCGRVMQTKGEKEKAVQSFLETRTIADAVNDIYMSAMADFYIGVLEYQQYAHYDARVHLKSAVKKFSTIEGKYKSEITTYIYIANTFLLEQKIDSALLYYNKGLEIAIQHHDIPEQIGLNQKIGVALLEGNSINLAKEAIKHAMLLNSETGNIERFPNIYISLAKVYQRENKIDSAFYYAKLSFEMSKDENFKGAICNTLSQIAKLNGKYQESLSYLQHYSDYSDSIYSEKQNQNVLAIQNKYDFELIQNANQRLMIEKLWVTIVFIVSVLAAVIMFFFIHRKNTRNKESLLIAQKQIYLLKEMVIEKEKKEDGKESEKNDEINKKLRNALNKQLDLFKKISLVEGFLSDENRDSGRMVLQKVNKIIYDSNEKNDWATFYQLVNACYDDYLERLLKAFPTLTDDETLLCCLSKMGLSNEEIRLVLKSTFNIIQKRKTSIREKLGMKSKEHFVKQMDELINIE